MLKIGQVLGPHGVRGEVKIIPLTDFPQRFRKLAQVTLRRGAESRELQPINVRMHKQCVLMGFKEIADRNQAEALRNWEVVIPVRQAQPLPPGRYYDHQLEGLEVFTLGGDSLGILIEVMHLPANAVYRVEKADTCLLIPALKSVVKKVDLENRRLYVSPLEGMLE